MNTRLQVEHPITEAVTGVDFVRAQIEIARGARLADMADSCVVPTFRSANGVNGHAIEVRVYAENPGAGFLPSPGRITHLRPPSGPGIRDDSGVFEGWTVPTAYDPLVSKVIAWAPDRPGAIARMDRALAEYDLRGINTTIAFSRELVRSPAFAAAAFDTTYVDRLLEQNVGSARARATSWRKSRRSRQRSSSVDEADREGRRRRRMDDRPPTTDNRRSTMDDHSGRSAHGWMRCDERRCHGERPAVEGRDRACRPAREAHRDDQRQDSRR